MVKNRLDELQQGMASKDANKEESIPLTSSNFLQRFEVIQKWIKLLQKQTQKCQELYQKDIKPSEMHKKLKEIFVQSETISGKIAENLKHIKFELSQSNDKSSANFRMNLIQYTGAVNQFKEVVEEQDAWMQKIHDVKKDFMQKCYKIVNNEDLKDDELEQIMTENPSIFTQDYMHSDLEARRQLLDVEERHKELTAIEEHLIEIRDMFVQIGTLVELQQESVNRVEYFAAKATDYLETANNDLQSAGKKKNRAFKMKIILLIVLLIVLAIILISIFVK